MFVCDNPQDSFKFWVNKGLKHKYFLQWYGLRAAALSRHKKIKSRKVDPLMLNPFLVGKSLKVKDYYSVLVNGDVDVHFPVSADTLIKDFKLNGSEELKYYFNLTYKTTKDNELRDLQYRLLTFIYNTNDLLWKKKLREDGKCDYCTEEKQTIYHLFFKCPYIRTFWGAVEQFLITQDKKTVKLDKKTVILGCRDIDLNLKILIGKFCIHKSKCNEQKPTLLQFTRVLKDRSDVQKNIDDSRSGKSIVI